MEKIDYAELDRKKAAEREALLEELGLKEDDIFEDDKGEYYWQEPCLMDDGDEPESGKPRKVYLE